MKNKTLIMIFFIVITVTLAITGITYAYWNWKSSDTLVTFTVKSNFNCSADAGGTINASNLIPTAKCNGENALKKEITTNVNGNNIYMNLWLEVISIDKEVSQSQNFKYVLTTSSTSCTTDIISSGSLYNKNVNDKVKLLNNDLYSSTGNKKYYLYIWLDKSETNVSTTNKKFSLKIGGECSEQEQQ